LSLLFLPEFNLQALNTLAVPACARVYVSVTDEAELAEALVFAKQQGLPQMILGGGSNIVLREDFPGLVIHMGSKGKTLVAEDEHFVWLQVAAGENWQELVEYTLEFHYWGLENLSLIPGTVGAAPIQNIGAYGVELCDVFAELRALEIESGVAVTFTADGCAFGYRDSVFKQALKDRYVITAVTFKLRKEPQLKLSYPALNQALAQLDPQSLTPLAVSHAVCEIRRSKLPDPAQIPNVGSFFKNPIIPQTQFKQLQQKYPDISAFPISDERVKVAAGWLIDRAGWRGFSDGPVAVHEQQALVLTNSGKAGGDLVLALADKIIASIQSSYGITLEAEPRIYP
jgi:UDP-N-acetylmuramate dehydrogenase